MSAEDRSPRHQWRTGRLTWIALIAGMGLCTSAVAETVSEGELSGEVDRAGCPVSAKIDQPLFLVDAVDLALCNNPQIRASWAVIRQQAAVVGEARAAYWPTLSATAGELRDRTSYPGTSEPATARTGELIYGAFDWRLFDFGTRGANHRAAQAQLVAATASADATLQKVLASVVRSYFESVTAVALVSDKRGDQAAAQQTVASAERRAAVGRAAQNDVLQSHMALAKSVLDVNRAQAEYSKAISGLIYLLGLPIETTLRLPANFHEVEMGTAEDLQDWLTETERDHPAIRAAQAALEAAREQVTSARASGLPTLDLTANYYQNGFPNQGLNADNTRVITFGLSISVPLFDGFARHYRVDEANALVRVKEAELQDTRQATLMAVISAHADAVAALQNLRASEELLQAAQAANDSSRRRYEGGAGEILELLSTQTARIDAEQERVRCLADWHMARLLLLASAGRLDRASVQ